TFTKGPDQSATVDGGASPINYTVPHWATNISAGAANESGQALNFVVTNNNNGLFAGQPAVAPDGTLTYQTAPFASGAAVVTVVLHDNGGTANGGQDSSVPQTFVINVTPINKAPT